ncbi:hypothetical protein L1D54_03625 [Vibrio brasiliensis]|uniref:DUF7683 domain-containing protein n=1 Tax=Vibrio brasiliensis TaxID=170652 RepID=UPI001EFEB427|nr:hypothetical protein [Vibrio brasiliensis]MCG9749556.1 hypothetical protein [Vibrio brasiliensis]
MKVVVETFDKKSELLVSEIEVQSSYVDQVSRVLGLSDDDLRFLLAGAGGFDISIEQVKAIETIIGESFYSDQCDYQLGTR